jgi:hypothetical protein
VPADDQGHIAELDTLLAYDQGRRSFRPYWRELHTLNWQRLAKQQADTGLS